MDKHRPIHSLRMRDGTTLTCNSNDCLGTTHNSSQNYRGTQDTSLQCEKLTPSEQISSVSYDAGKSGNNAVQETPNPLNTMEKTTAEILADNTMIMFKQTLHDEITTQAQNAMEEYKNSLRDTDSKFGFNAISWATIDKEALYNELYIRFQNKLLRKIIGNTESIYA